MTFYTSQNVTLQFVNRRYTNTKELVEAIKNEKGSVFQNCNDCEYGTHNGEVIEKLNCLAELEDKLKNGTLIELPCKVGDAVYRIGKAINVEKQRYELYVQDYTIIKIEIYEEEILFVDNSDNEIYIVDFDKAVFLTKAEAEKKLKELRGKDETNE